MGKFCINFTILQMCVDQIPIAHSMLHELKKNVSSAREMVQNVFCSYVLMIYLLIILTPRKAIEHLRRKGLLSVVEYGREKKQY